MTTSKTIMKGKNKYGTWRLIAVSYASGQSYYVNNFATNGLLYSNRFTTFQEAYQFLISQKIKRLYSA